MSEASSRRRPSKKWTLRRRIGLTFAALTGVAVLLVAVVAFATVKFVLAGNDVVNRWASANLRTERLVSDLVAQQTEVRGFALTRNQAFVSRYRAARAAEQRDLARLQSLIGRASDLSSGVRLTDEVNALSAAAERWRRQIAEPAVSGIAAGDPTALHLAESSGAQRLFDTARAQARSLAGAVQRRTDDAKTQRRDYLVVFVVATALAVVVSAIAALFLWRGLHRWVLGPIDQLGAQTREVAGGDTYREISTEGPVEFTALGSDVEAMRLQIAGQLARAQEIQEELRLRSDELARSNEDLQQFAYVASHDLSEPLRKVANFCQLLERQYGPQLDDRARQYIDFAVDGAKRMQRLITDLLALSRVGRTTEQFLAVDLDVALDDALETLGEVISSANGRVERLTKLPVVQGDQSLLTSLFENLVGNAIKYRREDVPPIVRIRAEDDDNAWTISVCDNGIGIDPQYAERIFVVFQRLHLRDRYGGTGIGLALCRKIVEFHGGRIWLADTERSGSVESGSDSPGATFRFTFPKGGAIAQPRD